MMTILTNLFTSLAVFLLQIPMADTFRSDGKIYVLLAVVLIILGGLFIYLFRVDKKVKHLENEFENEKKDN